MIYFELLSFLAHMSCRDTRCAYRTASVRPSTLPNINKLANCNDIKFYLKHHWVGGKAALGFGADLWFPLQQIATVIQIATVVGMGKTVSPLFSAVFHPIFFILAGNEGMYELERVQNSARSDNQLRS